MLEEKFNSSKSATDKISYKKQLANIDKKIEPTVNIEKLKESAINNWDAYVIIGGKEYRGYKTKPEHIRLKQIQRLP